MIHPNQTHVVGRYRAFCLFACVFLPIVSLGCRSRLITDEDKAESIVAKSIANAQDAGEPKRADGPAKPLVEFSDDAFRDAALGGRIEIVREALASGTDISAVSPEGQTALQLAAFEGHTDIVKLLLDKGSDVQHLDSNGRNALMYASTGPYGETVKVLLAAGSKVDVADNVEGFTALMFAAAEGQSAVVELLLDASADLTMVDVDGDTAASFAGKNGHTAVVEMIEKSESTKDADEAE